MKRNAISVLQKWKNETTRNPFYLTGIKGVGKTYLAYDFANDFFESYLYLCFEHNKELVDYLESLEVSETLTALADYFEIPEELLYTTPFIFDEIYLCPNFIQKLWTAVEQRQDLFWIFISSYNVPELKMSKQFFEYTLYPIQFDEFLIAIGKEWYVEVIKAHCASKKKIPDIVHQELLSTFDEYLFLGGMPGVINEYLMMESSINVPERQYIEKQILANGILEIAEEGLGYKCRQIYSTIEEQLKKANQKFQFNIIRKGITYQMYQPAIDFLTMHHIAYRINHLEKEQQFKLFHADFSLLPSSRNGELTSVERQIRLQNYLIQTLAECHADFYFWESKSQASIDFIVKKEDVYFPIVLKEEGKSKSKSIHSFATQYNIGNCVRISGSNFVENDEVVVLPAYSLFCLKNMIDK